MIQPTTETARSAAALNPSETLDDRGVGHATALAHHLESVAPAGPLELAEQRRHEPAARASERVTERDRTAVRVHFRHVGVMLLLPRQHDRRERFVDLDEIDLVQRHAGALE